MGPGPTDAVLRGRAAHLGVGSIFFRCRDSSFARRLKTAARRGVSSERRFRITSMTPLSAPAWLVQLNREVVSCTQCPRLVEHCQRVAREKKRAYREHEYWGKPVPGWGDAHARVLVLGLAPGAHGSNRTGRPFTGDGSGNFL